jgi:hypothetical protein
MKFRVIARTAAMIGLSAAVVGLFSFNRVSATPSNIQRVSVSSSGTEQANGQSNEYSPARISGNGRYVVFGSTANNQGDIFVRDTQNNTTTRVNASSSGTEANGFTSGAAISYDGRYVVFNSSATNLVASDTNGNDDVFVRDTQNNTTTLVSVTSGGTQGNNYSITPAVSADGRFIVFMSRATNFATGVSGSNNVQLYVKDMATGGLRLITKNTSGNPMAMAASTGTPSISCDGGTVAFASNGTDLVASDTNGQPDVFVQSLVGPDDYRINITAPGDNYSENPNVSCNGNEIAFGSKATNLVGSDTNGYDDAFVYHRLSQTTERVSVTSSGTQDNGGVYRSQVGISGNGRYVSYVSSATNVTRTGYTYFGTPNVFVRDLKTGATGLVTVVYNSTTSGNSCINSSLSDDGAKVAFDSGNAYLVANDNNAGTDTFTADTGF